MFYSALLLFPIVLYMDFSQLNYDAIMHILEKTDYLSLKSLAMTDKRMRPLIGEFLTRKAKEAIRVLDLPENTNHHILIELLYHLNNDQSADPRGIIRTGDNWVKGNNSMVIEDLEDVYVWEYQVSWYRGSQSHRSDGPAIVRYNESGKKIYEGWYQRGNPHRLDGRAKIDYSEDGKITTESWYLDGIRHRVGGPAVIIYNKDERIVCERWLQRGLLHREEGPARIEYTNDGKKLLEEWQHEGKRHRDGGPAVRYHVGEQQGYEAWYNHGILQHEKFLTGTAGYGREGILREPAQLEEV